MINSGINSVGMYGFRLLVLLLMCSPWRLVIAEEAVQPANLYAYPAFHETKSSAQATFLTKQNLSIAANADAKTQSITDVPKRKLQLSLPALNGVDEKPLDNKTPTQFDTLGEVTDKTSLGIMRAKRLIDMNRSSVVKLDTVDWLNQGGGDGVVVESLTLAQTIAQALNYSMDVAIATSQKTAKEFDRLSAIGALLPKVDVYMTNGREYSNPSSITESTGAIRPYSMHNRKDSSLNIKQPLLNAAAVFELQRQHVLLKSSISGLNATQEKVAYEAVVNFIKLIHLKIDLANAQEHQKNMDKLFVYVKTRVEAGASAMVDMERVRGRVISAKAGVINAKGNYDSAMAEFKRLTGVIPASLIIPDSLLPSLPGNFEFAYAQALETNFDLKMAKQDEQGRVYEKRAVLAKMSPTLDIEASMSNVYNAGGVSESVAYGNKVVYPKQRDDRIMLVMNWNLFNGGIDLMQSQVVEAKRAEAEYHVLDVKRKIEQSIRINFNALDATSRQIEQSVAEVDSNSQVVSAFNEQLFSANRTLLEVLDAYQQLYTAQNQLSALIMSEATVGFQLLRNIGQLQQGVIQMLNEPSKMNAEDSQS